MSSVIPSEINEELDKGSSQVLSVTQKKQVVRRNDSILCFVSFGYYK
jgi:hypothetical protein